MDDHGSYSMILLKNINSTQSLGPSPFLPRFREAWYTPLSSTKLMPAFPRAWALTGSLSWIGDIEIRKKNLTCWILYCDGPRCSSNFSAKSPSNKVFVHLQNISAETWLWDFPKQKSRAIPIQPCSLLYSDWAHLPGLITEAYGCSWQENRYVPREARDL